MCIWCLLPVPLSHLLLMIKDGSQGMWDGLAVGYVLWLASLNSQVWPFNIFHNECLVSYFQIDRPLTHPLPATWAVFDSAQTAFQAFRCGRSFLKDVWRTRFVRTLSENRKFSCSSIWRFCLFNTNRPTKYLNVSDFTQLCTSFLTLTSLH